MSAAVADSLDLLVVCAGQLVRSIGDLPGTHDGHQLHADVKCERRVIYVDDLQITQRRSTLQHHTSAERASFFNNGAGQMGDRVRACLRGFHLLLTMPAKQ
jgi:hypothetical protein